MKNILMNTDITKAILDGRKTQFREVIKPIDIGNGMTEIRNPEAKYQIGETIFVKEDFYYEDNSTIYIVDEKLEYVASDYIPFELDEIIPAQEMKQAYSRIFLKVTNVRVERLQDMTHDDILAEGFNVTLFNGIKGQLKKEARKWWINLWNKTAPKGYKWENNPYVFVYEFERVEK